RSLVNPGRTRNETCCNSFAREDWAIRQGTPLSMPFSTRFSRRLTTESPANFQFRPRSGRSQPMRARHDNLAGKGSAWRRSNRAAVARTLGGRFQMCGISTRATDYVTGGGLQEPISLNLQNIPNSWPRLDAQACELPEDAGPK